MDYQKLSKEILKSLGGENNIKFVTHCATRLRVTVKNQEKVEKDNIKKCDGVLGLVDHNDELQIIIGTDVNRVYDEFIKLGNYESGEFKDDETVKDIKIVKDKKENLFLKFTNLIAGSVLPSLPIIVGGGMIRAILIVLTSFFGVSTDSGTYIILNAIYSAANYFLPIYIGYNCTKKLGAEAQLGALLGGVMVVSDISGVEGLKFLGIPVPTPGYSGGIIPVILGAIFLSVVYKPLDKHIPKEIKFFAVPMLTMVITIPVTLIILGPLGNYIGSGLGIVLDWLNLHLGWFSVGILGATFALMLFTGTAYGLYAIVLGGFAANGYEAFCQPAGLAANLAVGGAALAVMTMLKDKEKKGLAFSTGLTAVFGITEPAIFGVLGRYRKPFIGAVIGGGLGGLFAGITHVAEYAFASPGVASILAFMNPDGTSSNLVYAVITMLIAFISSFIATRIIGLPKGGEE